MTDDEKVTTTVETDKQTIVETPKPLPVAEPDTTITIERPVTTTTTVETKPVK